MSYTFHFCYKFVKFDFVSKEGKKCVLPSFEYAINTIFAYHNSPIEEVCPYEILP